MLNFNLKRQNTIWFLLSCIRIRLIIHLQEPKMKNLYRIQFLLVGVCSLLFLPLASSQIGDPLVVNVKNSGSSFVDQFSATTDYAYGIVQDVSSPLGDAGIAIGGANTLKVTFTPNVGVIGTADLVVSYYTLSAPMHPVTRSYHFIISNEAIAANNDQFVVDINGIDIPLPVLDNDSISNGSLKISTVSVVNSGAATINQEGDAILFTPTADFIGDSWLQYIVCDSFGNCAEGKAHVLVRDPNVEDNITFQKYLLNQESLEVLTPFADFDVNNSPVNGSLDSINPITWTYTPAAGFVGNDTITLSQGNTSRTYIITVYSKAINVEAKDDKFYVRPGLSVTFNVLNNDLLDEYAITSHTNPTKGVLNEIGNGMFTYTPNTGFRGVDKFTYTTCFSDTVYCETATVLIHVTDLEPDNVFAYALQTSRNLPLTIDYPIAYTDFSYIISSAPLHGSLIFNEGVQQINLPCDTLDSYNMLVYTPDANYTGPDHFEYYYCVQPSNLCFLVKVNMDVVEEPEQEDCSCVVGCVWPGDGDLDGRVDMNDLLTLGYRLGAVGPARSYNDPSYWFGQHADVWSTSGSGTGIQYSDGNGDGAITSSDVDVISNHYNKVHDVVTRDVQQKLPYQFSLIPVQFSLDSGDLVILDISLGTPNVPVLDMKGTKFSVNIPASWMDSSSVTVDFHQNNWLTNGSPFISLGKVPWNGRIDAGFSKANGDGASGFGVIGTITFIITDDVEGFKTGNGLIQIPVRLEEGVVMDNNGVKYDVDGAETTLTYNPGNNPNPYTLIMYPNPAQDQVNIHVNGKTSIQSLDIIDTQGRLIRSMNNVDSKHALVDISALPMGLYYVQVQHEHGKMTQLLSVIR